MHLKGKRLGAGRRESKQRYRYLSSWANLKFKKTKAEIRSCTLMVAQAVAEEMTIIFPSNRELYDWGDFMVALEYGFHDAVNNAEYWDEDFFNWLLKGHIIKPRGVVHVQQVLVKRIPLRASLRQESRRLAREMEAREMEASQESINMEDNVLQDLAELEITDDWEDV